jgi:hypothetical protein
VSVTINPQMIYSISALLRGRQHRLLPDKGAGRTGDLCFRRLVEIRLCHSKPCYKRERRGAHRRGPTRAAAAGFLLAKLNAGIASDLMVYRKEKRLSYIYRDHSDVRSPLEPEQDLQSPGRPQIESQASGEQ